MKTQDSNTKKLLNGSDSNYINSNPELKSDENLNNLSHDININAENQEKTAENSKNPAKKLQFKGKKEAKISKICLFISLLSVVLIPLFMFFIGFITKTTTPTTLTYLSTFLIAFSLFSAPLLFYERSFFSKFKLKEKNKLAIMPIILLLCFLIWATISVFFATDIKLALFDYPGRNEGLIMYFAYAIIFLGAFMLKDEHYKTIIIYFFLSTISMFCLFWFIDYLFISRAVSFMGFNFTLPWANSNHSGYMLTMASLMSASIFLFSKQKNIKIFGACTFGLFVFTCYFNNTFGCQIAILISIIMLSIISIVKDKQSYKKLLIMWAIFVFATALDALLIFLFNLPRHNFIQSIIGLFEDIFKISKDALSLEAETAGTNRWGLWKECFNNIASHPIFGIGINCQMKVNPALEASRPHNEPLQFASTMGLPAGLFYISAIIITLILIFKQIKKLSTETLVCLMGAMGYFVSSIFGVSIPYTFPIFILFLGLGIGGFNFNKEIKQEDGTVQETAKQ